MKLFVGNYKGGVGKTSVAYGLADYVGLHYVTNDIITLDDPSITRIKPNLKRIPKDIVVFEDVVFDFGAMSTQVDPKVSHALKICDLVVIPTLTDLRSLLATFDFVELVKQAGLPYVIVINKFTQWKKYDEAKLFLRGRLPDAPILGIKFTTLFERVAEHGPDWMENVHNRRGIGRLLKTQEKHEEVYRSILRIGGYDVADA